MDLDVPLLQTQTHHCIYIPTASGYITSVNAAVARPASAEVTAYRDWGHHVIYVNSVPRHMIIRICSEYK
jgi:hypothetical protein